MIENRQGLRVPLDYYELKQDDRSEVLNTCGPDGFLNKLVPNSVLGLEITPACQIHDWEFDKARNQKDFEKADKNFKGNLNYLNRKSKDGKLVKFLRRQIFKLYYFIVRQYSKGQTSR